MHSQSKRICDEVRIGDDIVITVCNKKGSTIQLGQQHSNTVGQPQPNDVIKIRLPSMTIDDLNGE